MSVTTLQDDNLQPYMGTLQCIVSELGSQKPFQSTLKSLLQTLSENHNFRRPHIVIFDPETRTLKLTLAHGLDSVESVEYEPGVGVTGQVFATGAPVIVPRMKEHPAFLNKAFGRTDEELAELAFICVPITVPGMEGSDGEVIGTLSVDLPSNTTESLEGQRRFLEVVAGMVANHATYLQEEIARQNYMMAQGVANGDLVDANAAPANIIVASKSMKLVLNQISQVGPSRATALLRGESGTGKELLAEAIHQSSPRREKSLIKLNCAALPSELVESELFGYQKGAFTGAVQDKKGLFELADNGTLFLDEVGELSPTAQAKVLRAIQEQEIQRLGSEKTLSVDVRLICATHRPLEELVEKGEFREDLYYRINVFPVFIPPLRERREDILPLSEHFLSSYADEYERNIKRISTPAIDLLMQYHWPGNIRELKNCIERAVLVCDEQVIRTYHLPPSLQTAESTATDSNLSFCEAVAKFEQELLVDALKKARGNMLQAARDLRVSYRIVNYKVKKYGIDAKKFAVTRGRVR
ncbi:sigma 54-interacting transcriptional regulator [Halodesulfovibrio aestuarii]|uniref:sigma-54-dependent Fis family transcriptional regulator n=1 Tax=Halodesulfovibrio aestuarii TaxID=126333 RepID=UPI003D357E07